MARRASASHVVDPAAHQDILGATFVKREQLPLLEIGQHRWNRWTLGRLGCPHAIAALALNRTCKEMGIRTLDGLAKHVQMIGQFRGNGVTVYWLALAILEQAGYNIQKVHGEDVSFLTIKTRARTAARKRPARRPRRAGPPSDAAEGVM